MEELRNSNINKNSSATANSIRSPKMGKSRIFKITKETEILRPYSERIAINVRMFRVRLWMSQAQLAQMAGIEQGCVSSMESGWGNPTLLSLVKIAKVLKVPVAKLLTKES